MRSFPVTTVFVVAYNFLLKLVPRNSGVFMFYISTFTLNLSFVYVLLYILSKWCKKSIEIEPQTQSTTDGPRYEGTTRAQLSSHRVVPTET